MDEKNEIFKALANFQGQVTSVPMDSEVTVKTKTGGTYKFKYATLLKIVEHAKPLLKENGLAVTQLLGDESVRTILTHESGQFIETNTKLNFTYSTPQELGSIYTYIRRYAYASILGLVADEDDDANLPSGNEAKFTTQGGAYNQEKKQAVDVAADTREFWNEDAMTDPQRKMLHKQAGRNGMDHDQLVNYIKAQNKDFDKLTKGEASDLIEELMNMANERAKEEVDINF